MHDKRVYIQSGAVPFLIDQDQISYVLITSMGGNWIFPKGLVEPAMKPWESALAEAEEAAGVTGQIIPDVIATYEYEKWSGLCRIDMYLLKVTDIFKTWEEQPYRQRKICSFKEAKRIIHHRVKNVLHKADLRIKSLLLQL